MIAYIFSSSELKLICKILKIKGLAKHQFSNSELSGIEYDKALQTLMKKEFIVTRGENIIINSGITVLVETFKTAKHLLIGDIDRIFTAYISTDISVLLINDTKSDNFWLYPYENEDKLVDWLHDNNIYAWKDIRLEER